MSDSIQVALIGGFISLMVAIVPKLIDNHYGTGKAITQIQEDLADLKRDSKMQSDIIYQMLDHMSTNNNTKRMKEALDKYNAYFRG